MSARRRITLVGESPAPGTTAPFARGTSSRRRLEQMVGAVGVGRMVLRNVYRGSCPPWVWNAEVARCRAKVMQFRTPIVLLAGRRVAAAFGLRKVTFFYPEFHRGRVVYVIPHPSGRNQWWNTEENREQARTWFAWLLEGWPEERLHSQLSPEATVVLNHLVSERVGYVATVRGKAGKELLRYCGATAWRRGRLCNINMKSSGASVKVWLSDRA